MNIAILFAGGTGQRMNTNELPKQFLKLHGKPIIMYTIAQFASHEQIDGIVVACLDGWLEYLQKEIEKSSVRKDCVIVTGGATGQESIYRALKKAKDMYGEESVVLINDGVRPLISHDLITRSINAVREYGNSIAYSPAGETVLVSSENKEVQEIIDRKKCRYAKAPQCFLLKDIFETHERALKEKRSFIDCASMMEFYGYDLHLEESASTNIKITSPIDFYVFRALIDAYENSQLGLPEGMINEF